MRLPQAVPLFGVLALSPMSGLARLRGLTGAPIRRQPVA